MTKFTYDEIREGDVFVNDKAQTRFTITRKRDGDLYDMFLDGSCGELTPEYFELGFYRLVEHYKQIILKGVKDE